MTKETDSNVCSKDKFIIILIRRYNCNIMLQSHQWHEKELSRDKREMTDLVMSYVFSSHFLQYLRHTYGCFLHLDEEQRKNLIKSAEIFRIKQGKATVIINYNQPTISVLIYGELKCKQKSYNKGDYFMTGEEKVEVEFNKKTSMVMLNKAHFEHSIALYEQFYYKKTIMEKILPTQILAYKKSDYQFLHSQATIISKVNKQHEIINQKDKRYGVFVLFEGVFQIINKKNVKLTEISCDYFGEESLWSDDYQFTLRPSSYQFKYIFFPKAKFLQTLNSTKLNLLKQFYSKKRDLLLQIEHKYEENVQYTKLFMQNSAIKKIQRKLVEKDNEDTGHTSGKIPIKFRQGGWKQSTSKKQRNKQQYYSPNKTNSPNPTNHYNSYFNDKNTPSKDQFHKRAQTVVLFKKSSVDSFEKTGKMEPSFSYQNRFRLKKSHSYGSGPRSDRLNLQDKIQRYRTLKAFSTLKHGEIILKVPNIAQMANRSFSKFEQTLKNSTKISNLHTSTYYCRTTRSKSQNLTTWR